MKPRPAPASILQLKNLHPHSTSVSLIASFTAAAQDTTCSQHHIHLLIQYYAPFMNSIGGYLAATCSFKLHLTESCKLDSCHSVFPNMQRTKMIRSLYSNDTAYKWKCLHSQQISHHLWITCKKKTIH